MRRSALAVLAFLVLGGMLAWYFSEDTLSYQGKALDEWLIPSIDDPPIEWEKTRQALRSMRPRVVPALLNRFETRDTRLRRWASDSVMLSRVGLHVFKAELRRQLGFVGFYLLGEEARAAMPAIRKHLYGDDRDMQSMAAGVIGQIGGPERDDIPRLLYMLSNHTTRPNALFALSRADYPPSAVPQVVACLEDPDFGVRCNAVRALAQVSSVSGAKEGIIRALHDSKWQVRYAAALVLQKLGPDAREAVPDLEKLVSDPNMGQEARIAIEKIGRVDTR